VRVARRSPLKDFRSEYGNAMRTFMLAAIARIVANRRAFLMAENRNDSAIQIQN